MTLLIEGAIEGVKMYHLQRQATDQLELLNGFKEDYLERKRKGLRDWRQGNERPAKKITPIRSAGEYLQPLPDIIEGDIAKQLLGYRDRLGIGLLTAAEATSLDPSHLYRLEHNQRKIGKHGLRAVIGAYGLSIEQAEHLITSAGFNPERFVLGGLNTEVKVRPQLTQSPIRKAIEAKIDRELAWGRYKQELLGWRLFGDYIKWLEKGLHDEFNG